MIGVYLALMLSGSLDAQHDQLERAPHDHTIFILRAESNKLAKFHSEIGENWEGGMLLKSAPEDGYHEYWAFSWRTARQARAFMMPAIFGNLGLEIKSYRQLEYFPQKRKKLDKIIMECGGKTDPFLILPTGKIARRPSTDQKPEIGNCITTKINAFPELMYKGFGFFGNEVESSGDKNGNEK